MNTQNDDALAPKRTGRPSSPETRARLTKIMDLVKANPGVTNPEVAKHLGVPTLQTSVLVKRLVRDGHVEVKKVGRGLTYNVPGATPAEAPAEVQG